MRTAIKDIRTNSSKEANTADLQLMEGKRICETIPRCCKAYIYGYAASGLMPQDNSMTKKDIGRAP